MERNRSSNQVVGGPKPSCPGDIHDGRRLWKLFGGREYGGELFCESVERCLRFQPTSRKESQDVNLGFSMTTRAAGRPSPEAWKRDSHPSFTAFVDWAGAVNASSKEDATAICGSLSRFLPLFSRFLIVGSPCLSSSKNNQWDASALANGVGHCSGNSLCL
jgi:hypothetical protein